HLTSTSTTLGVGAAHPTSSQSFSVLVQMIESMVGNGMKREGKEIFTNPGDPIKIFMLDPKWKTVVDLLLENY
ncbi:MAG: hypothetical protein KJ674_05245, partial [Nanoarchaeota archaeon]|nr:hypothetical protein [Nanoarchaeota archaeon]